MLRRLVVLDALTPRDRREYAEEVSALYAARAGGALGQAEREALLKRLPVLAEVEPARPDLRFQPVKTLARLAADPGGIEGFVRLQGLTGAGAGPPRRMCQALLWRFR